MELETEFSISFLFTVLIHFHILICGTFKRKTVGLAPDINTVHFGIIIDFIDHPLRRCVNICLRLSLYSWENVFKRGSDDREKALLTGTVHFSNNTEHM